MKALIYHNPKCSKSRMALEILNERGLNPEVKLYLKEALSFDEIKNILDLLEVSPRDIMRKQESVYKEKNLDDNISDEELINFILDYPVLLERPIVIFKDKAVICRPAERVFEIL